MDILTLKKEIEQQKQQNESLFKVFQYKMHKPEMQSIIEEWREGSKKLKTMINELQEIELNNNEIKRKENVNTFVNGYGEATKRNITTSTYERNQKRLSNDMLNFIR